MSDPVQRAIHAPDDHPGWSHLRADLLAAYSRVPMPDYTDGDIVHMVRLLQTGKLRPALVNYLKRCGFTIGRDL